MNEKMTLKKITILSNQLSSVKSKINNSDGLIANDTTFNMLRLKDGCIIKLTLYHYGKDAEKEIFETFKGFTL